MRGAIASAAWIGVCVLALKGDALAEESLIIPSFVEETESSGLDSRFMGDWEYMVGGGAATFDCNADGFPDLFLSGGSATASFYRNTSRTGGPLRFEIHPSGLELDAVLGAYPLDIDSNGTMDVVLLRNGENVAMRGMGNCRFERANELWGFDGGDAWSTAFSATWERGEKWPTLAIGNYIDRHEEISPWGSCTDNWLHRPRSIGDSKGSGFAPPVALKPSYCPLSVLFTDWNRSGTPSLRVSNDREYYEGGQEQMWRVEPGKTPALYTEAEGWKYLRIWGMGIASHDLDEDGYPEYFLTSMADNKLQTLANVPKDGSPRPEYKDMAYAKGVTAHRPYTGGDLRPSTAWHTQFEDVNNDGLVDLFVAKGNVAEMPDFAAHDPNNLLMQVGAGKFVEMGDKAGVASLFISRGGALTDFNLDGLVDIVVVNRWEKAQLWRNITKSAGHWLQVRPLQPAPNNDAIGSWIEARLGSRIIRREVTSGGGHAGGQAGWYHFGLGTSDQAEIRVIWPDGPSGDWQKVKANGFYVLERNKPVHEWKPG
jgi:hypothetical protein